jgi:peptidoglycan/xylan/chitin deacetylase (PgdA/CDA1 family)
LDNADVVFIKRILQVELDEALRIKMVDALFNKYIGVSESEFAKELYMNENEIKEMLSNGMHIGCHGYNHYWWNRLAVNELEKEIDLSLKFLDDLGVNLTNWTAAYPYGSHSKEVEQLLQSKKCRLAFTTEVGIAKTSNTSNLIMKRLDTNDIPKSSEALVNDWFLKSL